MKAEIITGLFADIPAEEVRDLANARAERYESSASSHRAIGGGPGEKTAAADARRAESLRFFADHVSKGAVYRLDTKSLEWLGVPA